MTEPVRLYPYQPFEQISGRHFRYTPEHSHYRLDLTGMWQDRTGIHGRVKIYAQSEDRQWHCKHFEDGHLSTKVFYDRFLKTAQEINPALPWLMWFQAFLLATVEATDRIEPALRASAIPLVEAPTNYCADLLQAEVPNLLWAQGGTGKSWLAGWLAVCIASGTPWLGHPVRQGPVLYYDWEAGPTVWRRRVNLVARGLGLDGVPDPLHYRYCSRPLAALEETFYQDLHDHHIAAAMFDALGGAEGERKEFSDSRDGIMAVFAILRTARITGLLIDHVAGEGLKTPRDVAKPYGSVYKLNQARNAWMLVREPSSDARIIRYELQHKKVNDGVLNQRGYAYELDGSTLGKVQFHPCEPSQARAPREWVPEMDALLCTRPSTVSDIAAHTRQSVDAIKKYLQRHTEEYEGIEQPGRATLWRVAPPADPQSRDVPF
jgi:hypothetical protein